MQLTIKDISISYSGEKILNSVSAQVEEGEFVAILGPSGCGKSTLLNILAGILPAQKGEVLVNGEKVGRFSPHFAYMPQEDLLMPWKRIIDNVCLYGGIHGSKKEARAKAMDHFEAFGLSGYEQSFPRELSGGMRQRAAFLRTALCPAEILLLDEPFAALDVITRGEMQDWLLEMREELGRTTVLVTHDIDEAIYLADRILILTGRPAIISQEVVIQDKNRDREWLYNQTQLKKNIHALLKEKPL